MSCPVKRIILNEDREPFITPYVDPPVPPSAKPVEANQSWPEEVASAKLSTNFRFLMLQRLSPKC
jgi:hypothetical protein